MAFCEPFVLKKCISYWLPACLSVCLSARRHNTTKVARFAAAAGGPSGAVNCISSDRRDTFPLFPTVLSKTPANISLLSWNHSQLLATEMELYIFLRKKQKTCSLREKLCYTNRTREPLCLLSCLFVSIHLESIWSSSCCTYDVYGVRSSYEQISYLSIYLG